MGKSVVYMKAYKPLHELCKPQWLIKIDRN